MRAPSCYSEFNLPLEKVFFIIFNNLLISILYGHMFTTSITLLFHEKFRFFSALHMNHNIEVIDVIEARTQQGFQLMYF